MVFELGSIIRRIFQWSIVIWILRFLQSMYTYFLVANNMRFEPINDKECIVYLKNISCKFPYYRYPKDLIIDDEGLDLIHWVNDDWNYVINLPKKLESGQKVILTKKEKAVIFDSSDGDIDWPEYFEDLTTYTYYDDMD